MKYSTPLILTKLHRPIQSMDPVPRPRRTAHLPTPKGISTGSHEVSPAKYKISIVGILEESLSDRLFGLTIKNTEPDQSTGKPVATLKGRIADQAALLGVLNTLYYMRMPLLSVECISVEVPKGE